MPRKMYQPTEAQRGMVESMAGFGIPQNDIAFTLEISKNTLIKHFARELQTGSIKATTKVAQFLFNMACPPLDAKTAPTMANVGAAIFWMKARAGWREVDRLEVINKHSGHVDINIRNATDAEISEELEAIERREQAATRARAMAAAVPKGPDKLVH